MTCPHCGVELAGLGTYCHACGRRPDGDPCSAPRPSRSEAQIRLAIRRAFEARNCQIWDTEQNRATRVTPGLSDLLVFGYGWLAFIEVKTPEGIQTIPQETFEAAVLRGGGTYTIMRDESEVEGFMRERAAA